MRVAWSVRGYGGICVSALATCWSSAASVVFAVPSACAACVMIGNRVRSTAMSVVGSCTAHCVSCALASACSSPSLPTVWYASWKASVDFMKGKYFFSAALSPVAWYCSHMYSATSGPLEMSSAFQFGELASLQDALAPGVRSPPLPLKRIVSGTQEPGRPPIAVFVHASICAVSSAYMSKIGVFRA